MNWTKYAGQETITIPDQVIGVNLSEAAKTEIDALVTEQLGEQGYSIDNFSYKIAITVIANKEPKEE